MEVTKKKKQCIKWDDDVFRAEARMVHGDKYDYSFMVPGCVINTHSYVRIICRKCSNDYKCRVDSHLIGTDCRKCKDRERSNWNLTRLLAEAVVIHGTKFSYHLVKEEHIKNVYSELQLICNTCLMLRTPTIHDHIHAKYGCTNCSNRIPYTLAIFITKAKDVYGEKFDYSLIKEEHIFNNKSRVPIFCKNCEDVSWIVLKDHIHRNSGCYNCSVRANTTLQKFLMQAYESHGELYDYSLVTEADVTSSSSVIIALCRKCCKDWPVVINHHVSGHKSGCPNCRHSKGELACEDVLRSLGITYYTQTQIALLPGKRYDLSFSYQGKVYLLEFDGRQHFSYIDFFHRHSENLFMQNQQTDILKTNSALKSGYCVIRIDYTQIENIEYHIRSALVNNYSLYMTDSLMYKYINDCVEFPNIIDLDDD